MTRCLEKCNLYLYADDSCLVFQCKSVKTINDVLTKEFSNLCDWFIDNRLSIHFGRDKTKSILFCPKRKKSKVESLDITYRDIKIHQHEKVSYLGCILDDTLNGESMALNVLNKINCWLAFLYRKQKFLTPYLRRLLCNSLIQPNFDYACLTWYPSLNKKLQQRLQTAQNKCIRFCLQLSSRTHIDSSHFKKLNWLSVQDRFSLMSATCTHKFVYSNCPKYIHDILNLMNCPNETRNSFLRLSQPCPKPSYAAKRLSHT